MTKLERQNYTRHMEYASLKSLHREHHLLRPLITHAKKSSAPSERNKSENSQNGLGPFLQTLEVLYVPFAEAQRKRKTVGLEDMTSRNWFSLKKFLPPSACYQQEAPPPWSQSMILLWGGGTRHPGFFQAFPTRMGGPP